MKRWAPIILLLVLVVVFLYRTVIGGMALLPAEYLATMYPWSATLSEQALPQWNPLLWDGIAQYYPWRVYYSQSISQGFVPLWNPHQFCGAPFAAGAQSAVFYPLNLLFVIISPVRAFGYSAALHLFLAGVFTFMLLRSLGIGRFGATVAGVTFAFSGFMVVWLELPTFASVAAWLPLALYLILWASDRASFMHSVFAGLVLGLSVLGGHFQIASYVWGAAGLWWIWLMVARARVEGTKIILRRAIFAILCFVAAFLIASPQILQTLELAGLSHRVREITTESLARYMANGIPAWKMITLFVPNFYGNPSSAVYIAGSAADFIEHALYVGLLPMLLAVIGSVFAIRWRGIGYFLMLALLSLLLAFGTAINALPYYFLPGTTALGGPNRTIVLFCFAAAVLAGYGAHWFAQLAQEEYRATGRRQGWRALTVGGAIFVVMFLMAQFIASAAGSELGLNSVSDAWSRYLTSQYLSFASLLLAGFGVLALFTTGYLPKPVFAGLALAVIVGDLFSFGMGFNPVSPPEKVYPRTALTQWIERNAGSARLMPLNDSWSLYEHPDATLPPNSAMVFGFYDTQGYDSLFPRIYKEFADKYLETDSSPPENGNMLFIKRYVPDWPQGTAGFVLSRELIEEPGLKHVAELDGVHIYRRTIYGQYEPAYLERSTNIGEKPLSRAWVAERTPNAVVVLAQTDQVSRLVLADTYYPGWKAVVGGKEEPVSVAQGVFRAVTVDPGETDVVFRFEPGTFVVGAFLGLLGVTLVGVAAGMSVVERRRG